MIVSAAPKGNVVHEKSRKPRRCDYLAYSGKTGRDGVGGATGSSPKFRRLDLLKQLVLGFKKVIPSKSGRSTSFQQNRNGV